jgi:hypothetical protein
VIAVSITMRTMPVPSRYAHYGDVNSLWLVVTPVSFVTYQIASILVLARIEPMMHAVLNAIKRTVIIGVGSLWVMEPVSFGHVIGIVVAIMGAFAYSLSKTLRSNNAHTLLRLALALIGALSLAAWLSGAFLTVENSFSASTAPESPANDVATTAATTTAATTTAATAKGADRHALMHNRSPRHQGAHWAHRESSHPSVSVT